MNTRIVSILGIMMGSVMLLPDTVPAGQRTVSTEMTAVAAYEDGFVHEVMRASGKDGIRINDMMLIEDDGPGAGVSEKGTYLEEIFRGVLARKTFLLEDPSALEAHVVLFMQPLNKDRRLQVPFFLILNGARIPGNPIAWHEGNWHWVSVPVRLLKKGENSLVLGCDAPKGEGYQLYIARADEYEGGGSTPAGRGVATAAGGGRMETLRDENSGKIRLLSIGKNSARSTNGGRTWVRMKLGNTSDVIGEYTIRLNLKRYHPEGSLLSPPIDLWSGIEGMDRLVPHCTVSDLRIEAAGETPEGTAVLWQYRTASTPDMMDSEWAEFRTIGAGAALNAVAEAGGNRYLQWRAVLKTSNPLQTPVVKMVRISRTLDFTPPPVSTFYVTRYENVRHRYSSIPFSYERWNDPRLAQLRERLKLDELLEGAVTDFEKINRVRHLVSRQWRHGAPTPGYPEWNALDILDRRDRLGVGGMCIQFSIVCIQSLLSLGYQARHINMFSHETVEVYVDELGKWVHIDPESVFDSYEYHALTGEPLNTLDQHRAFLAEYGFSAERPIDWQAVDPWAWPANGLARNPQPLSFSTFTGWINDPTRPDYPPQHALAGFLRMMPRNDYFSRPYPRPLTQGCTQWPWNGYLNWYDAATPRKLQYARHTDRDADFYPTLNRVEFSAVHTDREGEVAVEMVTFAPNFDGFEVNIDSRGWEPSPESFIWKLKRSAVNTLEMRVRNALGPKGKPSALQVMWHYKEPHVPRDW